MWQVMRRQPTTFTGTMLGYGGFWLVYDEAHVGHAMSALVFDIIRRYLEFRGYKVHHVMNFTDVDDKIIKRANELGEEPLLGNLLFVDRIELDDEYTGQRLEFSLIQTAIRAFGPCLTVAYEGSPSLSMEDCRELGFKRIAGSPFVFIEHMLRNPYELEGE